MHTSENSNRMSAGRRQRILIVEDNKAIIRAMTFLLQREGYETGSCEDESLYAMVTEWKPDLILMDLKMPRLDGAIAAKRLKSAADTRAIPLIVVTANNVTPEAFRRIGADELIYKPFHVNRLLESIHALIDHPVGGDEARAARKSPFVEILQSNREKGGPALSF